jgi:hypothetical protein
MSEGQRCQECPLIWEGTTKWPESPKLGVWIARAFLTVLGYLLIALMLLWVGLWCLVGSLAARLFFSKHGFKIAWLMPPETAHHFSLWSIRIYGALMNFIGRMCDDRDLGMRISNHVNMRPR